jgi:hypothetical protein
MDRRRAGSVSIFEAPTGVAGLDDVAVLGQPVEHGGGHLGVAEHVLDMRSNKMAKSKSLPLHWGERGDCGGGPDLKQISSPDNPAP